MGTDQALVKIRKVGVCGSDVHLYRTGQIGGARIEDSIVIGHECMGEVVDVGSDVEEILSGPGSPWSRPFPAANVHGARTARRICARMSRS